MPLVEVVLRQATRQFDKPYTYWGDPAQLGPLKVGQRVLVPFGRGGRLVEAYLIRLHSDEASQHLLPPHKPTQDEVKSQLSWLSPPADLDPKPTAYKAIERILDPESVFNPDQIQLAGWMVKRYLCTWGEALRLMIPAAATLNRKWLIALTAQGQKRCEMNGPSAGSSEPEAEHDHKIPDAAQIPVAMQAIPPLVDTLLRQIDRRPQKSIRLETLYAKRNQGEVDRALEIAIEAGWCQRLVRLTAGMKAKEARTVYLTQPDQAEQLLQTDGLRGLNQVRILELLLEHQSLRVNELCTLLSIQPAALKPLARRGLIAFGRCEVQPVVKPDPAEAPWIDPGQDRVLTSQQATVWDSLKQRFDELQHTFSQARAECLIHGVTGSGKTELYLRLTQRALKAKRGVILLVPEIGLTPQVQRLVAARFGDQVAVLHSRLTPRERYDAWQRIRRGEARIVVGARSAIFAPVTDLGLILIDEEQDASYQSENHPRFDARTLARARSRLSKALLVLGSATPSVVSYERTQTGKSLCLKMTQRPVGAQLPAVELIDLNREAREGNLGLIGRNLRYALRDLKVGEEQAILVLNRRGYATRYLCQTCGSVMLCPHCDLPLTYHQAGHRLVCHACRYTQKPPRVCPTCQANTLRAIGEGIQLLEEEIKRVLPSLRVLRMDQDTTQQRLGHENLLARFRQGEADLLIGTQMVAKGHDFPQVTLVGILGADRSLYYEDYQASERAFQLLTQAAGRAGRGQKPGVVYLQTTQPQDPILQAAMRQDYEAFYEMEIHYRRQHRLPPYAAQLTLTACADQKAVVEQGAERLAYDLKTATAALNIQAFPLDPSQLIKRNDRFFYPLQFKADHLQPLIQLLHQALALPHHPALHLQWQTDPQ